MKEYNKNMMFIYEKPKKYNIVFILLCIMIILVIICLVNIKCYSKLNVKGIYLKNEITISSTIENIDIISRSNFYKIDDKKYNLKILGFSEIFNDGKINLQEITMNSKLSNKYDNQVVDLTFYYNKELAIKKIIEGVFK